MNNSITIISNNFYQVTDIDDNVIGSLQFY